MAIPLEIPKHVKMRVVDRIVLSLFDYGFMPFDAIEQLVKHESLFAREWFPKLSVSRERIISSLLRQIRRGYIEARADNWVDGPIIARPLATQMTSYWFSPTPQGKVMLEHTAPWDLELAQGQLPEGESRMSESVRAFRDNPEPWEYEIVSDQSDPTRALVGWTSYHGILRSEEWGEYSTHVVLVTGTRPPKSIQAHFRPVLPTTQAQILSRSDGGRDYVTSIGDLFVLDVLSDDIESLALIVRTLNHEAAPYRRWQPHAGHSPSPIRRAVLRLVEAGYAELYKESSKGLVPVSKVQSPFDAADTWLQITPTGSQALGTGWPSVFAGEAP